jgi:hypothetical protein
MNDGLSRPELPGQFGDNAAIVYVIDKNLNIGFITTGFWDLRFGNKATEPLAAVPVYLRTEARQWQTVTDGMGSFDFPMLPMGKFPLSADFPRKLRLNPSREISLGENGCSQQILLAAEQGELRVGAFWIAAVILNVGPGLSALGAPWRLTWYPGVQDRASAIDH